LILLVLNDSLRESFVFFRFVSYRVTKETCNGLKWFHSNDFTEILNGTEKEDLEILPVIHNSCVKLSSAFLSCDKRDL